MTLPGIPSGQASEMPRTDTTSAGQWERMHPATPLLRGGIVMIVAIGIAFGQVRDDLVQAFTDSSRRPSDSARVWMWLQDPMHLVLGMGLVSAVLAVMLGWMWLSWRAQSYRVGTHTVEVRGGIIFRTHRATRYDRIQRVDVDRPFLARICGLARVVIGTANDSGGLSIAYLRFDRATALRARLLGLVRQVQTRPAAWQQRPTAAAAPPVEDLGEALVRQSNGRLLLATLLRPPGIVMLGFLTTTVVGIVLGRPSLVGIGLPWALALLWGMVRAVIRQGSLHLDILRTDHPGTVPSPDGTLRAGDAIRLGRGMLSRESTTVPVARIHAVEVHQPLLWRPFGWWSLRVNVAGAVGGEQKNEAQRTLLAVGSATEVGLVLVRLRPGVIQPGDPSDTQTSGYTRSPRRALLLGIVNPSRNGYRMLPAPGLEVPAETLPGFGGAAALLLVRRGLVWRSLSLIPMSRVQSVSCMSGPISRCLGCATLRVQTVPGAARTHLRGVQAASAWATLPRWEVEAIRALNRECHEQTHSI